MEEEELLQEEPVVIVHHKKIALSIYIMEHGLQEEDYGLPEDD